MRRFHFKWNLCILGKLMVSYHRLSKYAHGNIVGDLEINEDEFVLSELAALEGIFCALKKLNCFHQRIVIYVKYVFLKFLFMFSNSFCFSLH